MNRQKQVTGNIAAAEIGLKIIEPEEHSDAPVFGTKYYFTNQQRIAQKSNQRTIEYYHADHLGSAIMMTDVNGQIIMTTLYSPFGETLFQDNKTTDYLFTGQELDEAVLLRGAPAENIRFLWTATTGFACYVRVLRSVAVPVYFGGYGAGWIEPVCLLRE